MSTFDWRSFSEDLRTHGFLSHQHNQLREYLETSTGLGFVLGHRPDAQATYRYDQREFAASARLVPDADPEAGEGPIAVVCVRIAEFPEERPARDLTVVHTTVFVVWKEAGIRREDTALVEFPYRDPVSMLMAVAANTRRQGDWRHMIADAIDKKENES